MRTPILRWLVSVVLFLPVAAAFAEWRPEGPFLGNVSDLAVDPSNPDTVYAATGGGGVWRSDDGGLTWQLPGDEMTSRTVRWVQVDPKTPGTLYAGVKKSGGPGLWRSTDRGASWSLVEVREFGHTLDQWLAFAPSSPEIIYVPATNLHYRSADGGGSWEDFRVPDQDAYAFAFDPGDPRVVFAGGTGSDLNFSRSEDGGQTWTQTGEGLQNGVKRLWVDRSTPSVLYALARDDLFKSTDRGDSWAQLDLGLKATQDVFGLVLDPSDPRVLWASTEQGLKKSTDGGAIWADSDRGMDRYLCKDIVFTSEAMLAATAGTGVYRSTDGGASWAPSSAGLSAGWGEWLAADPRQETVLAQLSVGVFRRDPAGRWTEIRQPLSDGGAAEIDGMVFDRKSPQTIHAFDASTYYRSKDAGIAWEKVEQKGPSMKEMMKGNLSSAQFRSLAQDPGNPKIFYAGSWSNDSPGGAVYKTTDGGKKWAPAGNGVPNDDVMMLRSGAAGTVFAVTREGEIFRTTNGGSSWTATHTGIPGTKINQLVVDPTTPTRLFAATEIGLFRSTDNGGRWERVSAGIKGDDVDAVVVDARSGIAYCGTFYGVFKSSDGGASWAPMSAGLMNTDVRALAIGGSPPRLWAAIAGASVHSTDLE